MFNLALPDQPARTEVQFLELAKGLLPELAMFHQFYIRHLTLDSRLVEEGSLFFAIKGHTVDGRDFIPQAIEKRATLILAQEEDQSKHGTTKVKQGSLIVYFYQLPQFISKIAGRFYESPSKKSKVVGITGTNGKTTVSYLIAQWLSLLGEKSAVLGTTGNGFLGELITAEHTTTDAVDLQKQLAFWQKEGARNIAIEVSSHGLDQFRVKDVSFSAVVFTNLTQDHLDYHLTLENYANAKKSLFTEHHSSLAVINIDDQTGAAWIKEMPHAVAVTMQPDPLEVLKDHAGFALWATDISYHLSGIAIDFESSWGGGHVELPLIGTFNANNTLVALATLLGLGYDLERLIALAPQLISVKGRMEMLRHPQRPFMVVDYAHTPDALFNALTALRAHCMGQLWCVWGCGGDRDRTKRPLMAKIVAEQADHSIITDDNPRTEDPAQIIEDCLKGLSQPNDARVIHDRSEAIAFAMKHAKPDDMVLVAGKGHETYQCIGHERFHFSDQECIQQLFEQLTDQQEEK